MRVLEGLWELVLEIADGGGADLGSGFGGFLGKGEGDGLGRVDGIDMKLNWWAPQKKWIVNPPDPP